MTLLLEVVSLQLEASDDTLTFKGHCYIYTQHVPKSTASTKLTERVRGIKMLPHIVNKCIAFHDILINGSVSIESYGYSAISPIGRIEQMSVKLSSQNGNVASLPFWQCACIIRFRFKPKSITVKLFDRFRKYGKCCPSWTILQYHAMVVHRVQRLLLV